jgi:hypothetical protein
MMRAFLGHAASPRVPTRKGDIVAVDIQTLEDLLGILEKTGNPLILERIDEDDLKEWPQWGQVIRPLGAQLGDLKVTIYDDYME